MQVRFLTKASYYVPSTVIATLSHLGRNALHDGGLVFRTKRLRTRNAVHELYKYLFEPNQKVMNPELSTEEHLRDQSKFNLEDPNSPP